MKETKKQQNARITEVLAYDIAQKLGFSESKVKTSLFRARGQLRELLTKEGINI